MAGQVIYHLLAASHAARAPWLVVVLVSCQPVLTLGFGGALTHLLRAESDTSPDTTMDSPAAVAQAIVTAPVPVLPGTATGRSRPAGRATAARKSRRAVPPDVDALMPLGWQVTADLAASGQPLTRDTLAAGLRAAGRPAGNARVGALLARLKTEAPADPADTPAPDLVPALADGGTHR